MLGDKGLKTVNDVKVQHEVGAILYNKMLCSLNDLMERISIIKVNMSILDAKGNAGDPHYVKLLNELDVMSSNVEWLEEMISGSMEWYLPDETQPIKEKLDGRESPTIGRCLNGSASWNSVLPCGTSEFHEHNDAPHGGDKYPEVKRHRTMTETKGPCKNNISIHDVTDESLMVVNQNSLDKDRSRKTVEIDRSDGTRAINFIPDTVRSANLNADAPYGLQMNNPIILSDCRLPLSNRIIGLLNQMGIQFVQ